jgi:twitching motility protein PilT
MDYQKFINELLTNVIHQDGSDLHLGVGRKPAIRINGQLVFLVNQVVLTALDMEAITQLFISKEKYDILIKTREMDFSYSFMETTHLRGNAYFQQGGLCIALRLIPHAKTLEELHLPSILATFTEKKQGFFLVVGPVGEGKSTTLATMVNIINTERAAHVVTIEDPIEFVYTPQKSIIDQRAVGIDTNDFLGALQAVLREDVNVILIGEMRNTETISAAVTAAETGHLVFSTLHTNNAAQTIDRIIDSFPANQQDQIRIQLASSLLGIFSQRLIPRITGGRVPAYELLINNNAVANVIREKRTHEINTIIETSSEQGMIDMNHSLIELVQKGDISMESAYQYSFNPKGLERMV